MLKLLTSLFKRNKKSIYIYGCIERQKTPFDTYHHMPIARYNISSKRIEAPSHIHIGSWFECGIGWDQFFFRFPEQSQILYQKEYDNVVILR